MGLKDDVLDIKKEFQEVKNQSFAMDLLNDYKKQNKRLFVIIIILIVAFMGLLAYTIYLLNDIGVVETTTQEVSQENDNGNNNFVGKNGDIINGKTNDKAK